MTPEERAEALMESEPWHAYLRGWKTNAHALALIAAAIREAIDAETEACAAIAQWVTFASDYDYRVSELGSRITRTLAQRAAARREAEVIPACRRRPQSPTLPARPSPREQLALAPEALNRAPHDHASANKYVDSLTSAISALMTGAAGTDRGFEESCSSETPCSGPIRA